MPRQAAPLLSVEHLTLRFGGLVAVDDVSFVAGRDEITALIGPNGAGKTSVFNCITGFYKPTAGRIALTRRGQASPEALRALTLSGKRHATTTAGEIYLLERMPDHEIARRAGVARTFQNIRLFPAMTLLENLLVAQHAELTGGFFFGTSACGAARRGAIETARAWLDSIGLLARADDPAGSLPYGGQRKLEIARALCTAPVLLCLDEPAAGLNPRESAELVALLGKIRDLHGTSILLVEHDMSVVMTVSDHVVVLDHGVKIAQGTPAEIRKDARVAAAYLGVTGEGEVRAAEAEMGA